MASVGTNYSTPTTQKHLPHLLVGALALGLFAFYLALHARLYDGDALKQASWNQTGPLIGAVNHPYSSLWYRGWWRLVEPFSGQDFDRRMAWMIGLNALLGSLSAALVANILISQGVRVRRATLAALGLGMTHAWFYHSTQTTEPMMAEFWLLLSLRLLLVTGARERQATVFGAITWAVAVAAYQTYVLAGLGLLWVVSTHRSRSLLWLSVAGFAGTLLFTVAAVMKGANDISGIIHFLTDKPDGEYWGFIRLSALSQVPIGLANAIAVPWPLTDWPGLRLGLQQLSPVRVGLLFAQIIMTLLVSAAALLNRPPVVNRRLWWGLLLIFLTGLFPPFYLLPYYNKLWLLPISALALMGGLALGQARRGGLWLMVLVAALFARNGVSVFWHYHRADNPRSNAAVALERSIQPNDLLVCDGWDHSGLYLARNPHRPIYAVMFNKQDPQVLADKIAETYRHGGRVFFFGLLELTGEIWAANDSGKRGTLISYAAIQAYKPRSNLIWEGRNKGFTGDLYELSPK